VEDRIALRSQSILDLMKCLSYNASASKNGDIEMVIVKWHRRFAKNELEGPMDAQLIGKPISISEVIRKKVIHFTSSKNSGQ